MILQEFTIDRYDWFVRVYYITDSFPEDDIIKDLITLGCSREDAEETVHNLMEEGINAGSIYSNKYSRESLLIIGKADSTDEFYDTFDHEKGHLAMHICIADNIDPFSEKYQYLVGEIGKKMFWGSQGTFLRRMQGETPVMAVKNSKIL